MAEAYEERLNQERDMARHLMAVIANTAFGSKGNWKPNDFWELPSDKDKYQSQKTYTPDEITDIYLERQKLMKTGKKTIIKSQEDANSIPTSSP